MHRTWFCDLKFRLGVEYLYCHQGDCRHRIVIRDMRLLHPQDIRNEAAYPLLLFQLKSVARKCNACEVFRATRVTADDKWARENPSSAMTAITVFTIRMVICCMMTFLCLIISMINKDC